MPQQRPRTLSHPLAAPTADDVRVALRPVTGADFAQVWAAVCGQAGLAPDCHLLSVPELVALTAAVAARPHPVGLVGIDLMTRVSTYRALLAHSGDHVAPVAADWQRAATEARLRGPAQPARAAAIAALDVFSVPGRHLLDTAARRAAEHFGAPIALVTVVLDGTQVFAGAHGLSGWLEQAGGTPVGWSFCATLVRTRAHYLVPDAVVDPLQRTNPLVTRDGIASYAGVPLLTSSGHVLGAHCLMSDQPRRWSAAEVGELQAMADDVVAGLERRHAGD